MLCNLSIHFDTCSWKLFPSKWCEGGAGMESHFPGGLEGPDRSSAVRVLTALQDFHFSDPATDRVSAAEGSAPGVATGGRLCSSASVVLSTDSEGVLGLSDPKNESSVSENAPDRPGWYGEEASSESSVFG